MKKVRIGVDSYGLYPLQLSPLEILKWAQDNGAEGVQFSGFTPEESKIIDSSYLKDLAQYALSSNLYLEWGRGQVKSIENERDKERRERDSNPRSGCPESDFQDRRLKPLGHPS